MNVPSSVPDRALDWMGLGHVLDLPGALPEVAATCSLAGEEVVLCGFSETHATDFERDHVARLRLHTVSDKDVGADPVAPKPSLTGLPDDGLDAVSCTSDVLCVATGALVFQARADLWNGRV